MTNNNLDARLHAEVVRFTNIRDRCYNGSWNTFANFLLEKRLQKSLAFQPAAVAKIGRALGIVYLARGEEDHRTYVPTIVTPQKGPYVQIDALPQ
jgi:hypothetical protein